MGLEEGRAEGRADGRVAGMFAALLAILEGRGLPVSEAERRRIESCADPATVEVWLRRAANAESVEGIPSV